MYPTILRFSLFSTFDILAPIPTLSQNIIFHFEIFSILLQLNPFCQTIFGRKFCCNNILSVQDPPFCKFFLLTCQFITMCYLKSANNDKQSYKKSICYMSRWVFVSLSQNRNKKWVFSIYYIKQCKNNNKFVLDDYHLNNSVERM